MSRQKILSEIDVTLDQLIKNAAALQEGKNDPSCETEMEALQKTQESLLARLLHLDGCLKKDPKGRVGRSIDTKREIFLELSRHRQKSQHIIS